MLVRITGTQWPYAHPWVTVEGWYPRQRPETTLNDVIRSMLRELGR